MGHKSRQMAMIFVDIESLIQKLTCCGRSSGWYPSTSFMIFWRHIIRQQAVHLSTLSSMFKMLLIGYLYGIKSETAVGGGSSAQHRLPMVLQFELDDTIPKSSHIQVRPEHENGSKRSLSESLL